MSNLPNERNTELKRYLESVKAQEGKPIIKKDDEKPKKETPKNDANNEYEYSDDKETDDRNW